MKDAFKVDLKNLKVSEHRLFITVKCTASKKRFLSKKHESNP